MVSELCEHSVRDGSDTHLETCSVVDKSCTMLSDGDFHIVRLAEVSWFERFVAFHEYVDHIHRNHGLSPCARNVRVYDCDYSLCAFDGCKRSIDRCSERYISVLVRRTNLDHGNVASEGAATVELLCLAEEYRNVVCISGLHSFADIGSDEECLMEEDSVIFRIGIWCRAFCMEMVDAYILKFSGITSSAESLDQYLWSACYAAQMDVVS